MRHERLFSLLDRYLQQFPEELVVVDHFRQFARVHADCFERTCLEGHITGSAWVVSPDHQSVLLTHHRKLGRWLQLGGHSDGQTDPFGVALREACEESGMSRFREPSGEAIPVPLDLDIHRIPARASEPAHLHLDVRYVLVAEADQSIVCSSESNDLRWIAVERVEHLSDEESLLRMGRKAPAALRRGVVAPVS